MYLIDTNVISEIRKGPRANSGVLSFFTKAEQDDHPIFLSVITIGELRRGVEHIRHRGDLDQAQRLETWLNRVITRYSDHILDVDIDVAQVWGSLRSPHVENAIDKLIAATALVHDLTVVTRNHLHFNATSLIVMNPFA